MLSRYAASACRAIPNTVSRLREAASTYSSPPSRSSSPPFSSSSLFRFLTGSEAAAYSTRPYQKPGQYSRRQHPKHHDIQNPQPPKHPKHHDIQDPQPPKHPNLQNPTNRFPNQHKKKPTKREKKPIPKSYDRPPLAIKDPTVKRELLEDIRPTVTHLELGFCLAETVTSKKHGALRCPSKYVIHNQKVIRHQPDDKVHEYWSVVFSEATMKHLRSNGFVMPEKSPFYYSPFKLPPPPIQAIMKREWPDLGRRRKSQSHKVFWRHEWYRHGVQGCHKFDCIRYFTETIRVAVPLLEKVTSTLERLKGRKIRVKELYTEFTKDGFKLPRFSVSSGKLVEINFLQTLDFEVVDHKINKKQSEFWVQL